MAWVTGKTPPPGRLPKGIATRFGRPEGSVGDRRLELEMNAAKGYDRRELRKLTAKYGKWHNPKVRREPPANMDEGWLVEEDYPPRVHVEPEPEPEVPEPPKPDPQDPQDPDFPR